MKRLILPVLFAPLLLAACGAQQEPDAVAEAGGPGTIVLPPESPMLQRIRVEPVAVRTVPTQVVSAPVRLEADPPRLARLRMPLPGRIAAIEARPGDAVRVGQVLLRIDSADAEAAVSAWRTAVATERRARQDVERAREIYAVEAIARRDLIAAETEHEQAQAELSQAQRALAMLGLRPGQGVQALSIVSPIAGRVLQIDASVGEFRADGEEPVATVADLSVLMAVAAVPENMVARLSPESRVSLSLLAWPDEEFAPEIRRIADVVDPQTRTVAVFLEIPNPERRLRPGMFGTVRLSALEREVPVVPVGTVLHRGDRGLVLVESAPGRFEMREVVAGARAGDWTSILDGLAAGERVVTDGALLLMGQR